MAVPVTTKNKKSQRVRSTNYIFEKVKTCNSGDIKKLYHGDNLSALLEMTKDENILGKIKLIYIDPPYNTGGDFETRDLVHAYSDNYTIDEYVEEMRKRLEIMHQLLSSDGSIYIHLDNKMVFHIKLLMDEIFGINNFKGMITRKKCKTKNWTSLSFGNISDYILFYGKTNKTTWNKQYQSWDIEKAYKEYPYIEEGTGRRYKKVPIHAPGIRNGACGSEWRGMLPPKGKHWQYTPDTLDELDSQGAIYWSSNGNPRRKVYLDESKGVPYQDIWLDFIDINNQNSRITGYPTEKNLDMLKLIISASSNPGDIILDCFAGSGTTLVAAESLGRQWIGVDIGDEAIRTIENRLQFGEMRMKDYDKQEQRECVNKINFTTGVTYDLYVEHIGM